MDEQINQTKPNYE